MSSPAAIALIASIEVAPGQRDRFLPLLLAHGERCLEDEPGTLRFEILLPRDDDAKVVVYEAYLDDAALGAHRTGSSFARWRNETAAMVVKLSVMTCVPFH